MSVSTPIDLNAITEFAWHSTTTAWRGAGPFVTDLTAAPLTGKLPPPPASPAPALLAPALLAPDRLRGHRRRIAASLLVSLIAVPAAAQTPMTGEEFDAYVSGKTLTYSQYDTVFGIEEYLADRKVRWSVAPDLCQYGSWYPEGDKICFVYEYDPDPHCWTFWQGQTGLTALSADDAPGAELSEVAQTDQPLQCPGPDVGV